MLPYLSLIITYGSLKNTLSSPVIEAESDALNIYIKQLICLNTKHSCIAYFCLTSDVIISSPN